jgi:hypothetical protein
LKTVFEKLAESAEVTNPLKEQFFGVYGALNDRFGVRWMFQTNSERQKETRDPTNSGICPRSGGTPATSF